MARELKLGLNTGYWPSRPPGPPPGIEATIAEAERLGFDSIWTAEAYGSDVLTPLAWWGATTERIKLGTAIVQMSARTAGGHRDGGDDDGPPLRRALHPRPRRLRPAGRRGLVRPAVRQAAGAHARVHRDRARHHRRARGRSTAPARTTRSRYPDGTGPGQAAEVDRCTRVREDDPDLPRRRGPEERRAVRRALRRLARALLLARATRASTATRWPRASRARAPGARSTTSRCARPCR